MIKNKRKSLPPHWYKTTIYLCILCGHEHVYKERMFTPRPEDYGQRVSIHETACWEHFL